MSEVTTNTPVADAFAPSRPSQNQRGAQPLFSDPTAQAVWAAMLTLDVALQHEFLGRLRERLAVPTLYGGTDEVRTARLVAAVREAEDLLVTNAVAAEDFDPADPPRLTEDAYSELRVAHRDHGWPAASTLRNWVQGSWNDVLRRALLSPIEGADAVLMVSRVAFTWEDVKAALLAYRAVLVARNHPSPEAFSMSDYIAWARLPSVVALPGRRPRSQGPFAAFGGFYAAKAAALTYGGPPPSVTSSQAEKGLAPFPASKLGYGDEKLKKALDEVVAYLHGRTPRATDYVKARKAILAAEEKAGLAPRPFPSYNQLHNRWRPNWDAVLVACGYEPLYDANAKVAEPGESVPRPNRRRISDQDLLDGVREAFAVRGKPFTCPVYVDYVRERGGISKTGHAMASFQVIYGRFGEYAHERGVFNHVCDLALPAGWDDDHTETLTAPYGHRHPISDDELLAGLREAFEVLGRPFTSTAYVEYWETREGISRAGARMASYQTIYKRYKQHQRRRGAFTHACDLALPEGWDVGDGVKRRGKNR